MSDVLLTITTYFVHEDGAGRSQTEEVRGEEGEIESCWVEQLEGGGQQQIENNLRQYQSH